MQRLDLKSLRYDKLGRSVLANARGATVEITHEALEALANHELDESSAILKVAEEQKRLTMLAEIVPADDGRIRITSNVLMSNGLFENLAMEDGERVQ